jgi:uncharacterized membrane protein YqgA involved in biofilm formation
MAGLGTLINVAAVVLGAAIGSLAGHQFPRRIRDVITDGIGMVTILIAALSAVAITDPALTGATGKGIPELIVLGAIVLGGIAGAALRIEQRLNSVGGALRARLAGEDADPHRHRFIEGFVTASLVFCVGPLAILGPLSDGLGHGIDQLLLKSMLDFFTGLAFATSFGWGVAFAALPVLVVQGVMTVAGLALGGVLPDPHLAALTATGGLLLAGVGLRLMNIKAFPSADLLPALVVAPLLTQAVIAFS